MLLNFTMQATLLTTCHTSLQFILTIPDKLASYNGGKFISKQAWMKAKNSGATIKRSLIQGKALFKPLV